MNPHHVRALVSRRMEQATECLEDGRYLLTANRGARTVVNRAYYAAFYAVLALLQTTGAVWYWCAEKHGDGDCDRHQEPDDGQCGGNASPVRKNSVELP